MPLANNICNTIVLTVVLIWVPRNKQADLGQDFSKNEENNAETSSTNTDIFLNCAALILQLPWAEACYRQTGQTTPCSVCVCVFVSVHVIKPASRWRIKHFNQDH